MPGARHSDPHTSHAAARSMVTAAATQRERVLRYLRSVRCAGAEQIGEAIGLDPYAVRKRLPELLAGGKAEPLNLAGMPSTRPTSSGRRERVWRAR